jgi:hypothetical protein
VSAARQAFVQDGDALRHSSSATVFPKSIGPFQRAARRVYNAEGTDVSVGYNLRRQGSPVIATVYIYPAPPLTSVGSPDYVVAGARAHLLKDEFERREQEIRLSHSDASLLNEAPASLKQGGTAYPGWVADFSYMQQFEAGKVPVLSKLVVIQCPDTHWVAEYRFTYAAGVSEDQEIISFMQTLKLPAPI